MPQLPKSFSAYPTDVTLDGNGDGAIRFQAVGSNIRITNLSVRASSATAQATATVYKNQIGEGYRLSGTNSGSTGDNLSIPTDLFDGESIIVVWAGGDPGATATATFSGKQLPFDEVGSGEGGANWNSPIAAGDGSLVYPALKSPNFVTTVSGWLLDRNGNAEVNNVTVRGDLLVNGSNGSFIRIADNAGQPTAGYRPEDFTSPGVGAPTPGVMLATSVDIGAGSYPQLSIVSPEFTAPGYDNAQITLRGETWDSSSGPAIGMIGAITATGTLDVLGAVDIGSSLDVAGPLVVGGIDSVRRRVTGVSLVANSAAIGNTETVVATVPAFTYEDGCAYEVVYTSLFNVSVAPNRPQWRVRKTNIAGTVLRTVNLPAVSTGQHTGEFLGKFVNTSGSAVNTTLAITLQGSAAFNATQLASVGPPAQATFVDVYYIGLATDNPNAVSI